MFSDRIEVTSPGGYVHGMDPERLRRGEATPHWRNPALASFLLKLQLAQNQGQGLRTILTETRITAGRDPQILPSETEFEVRIPAFRPLPRVASVSPNGEASGQGLILISIGGPSIRPVVEHSLGKLGLEGAEVLVDFALPEYVSPDVQHWEAEAARIRDQVRVWVENPRFSRIHLFYRGPVVIAPSPRSAHRAGQTPGRVPLRGRMVRAGLYPRQEVLGRQGVSERSGRLCQEALRRASGGCKSGELPESPGTDNRQPRPAWRIADPRGRQGSETRIRAKAVTIPRAPDISAEMMR